MALSATLISSQHKASTRVLSSQKSRAIQYVGQYIFAVSDEIQAAKMMLKHGLKPKSLISWFK